jgi:hypothetical protein
LILGFFFLSSSSLKLIELLRLMRSFSPHLLINHQLARLRGVLEQLRKARSESCLLCHLREEVSSWGCFHAPPLQLLFVRSALWHVLWLVVLTERAAALGVVIPALATAARALIWWRCLRGALASAFFAFVASVAEILLLSRSSPCSFVAITGLWITGTYIACMRSIKPCLRSSLLSSTVLIWANNMSWCMLQVLLMLLSDLGNRPDSKVVATLFQAALRVSAISFVT